MGRGPRGAILAGAMAIGLRAFGAAMTYRPTRKLLNRVLPAPGAGPSTAPQLAGSLTPATALGNVLSERLRAAGHTSPRSRNTSALTSCRTSALRRILPRGCNRGQSRVAA
jgi:short subunit dehydrogenase-like uncharacterized protein